MSSIIKPSYGTNGQTVTITLASLATASAREATAIDNRTNLYLDALVFVQLKTSTGTIGSDPYAYVYVAGTVDDGTTWPDTVTGSDAAITLNTTTQLRLLGAVWLGAVSTTYKSSPFSVAAVFGGVMPAKWSLVVKNNSGVSLTATAGDHKVLYQGIQAQVV